MAFDRPLADMDLDAVVVENRAGAEQATQHLIDHGHKRIACVGYDEEAYTIQERIAGFESRMLAHGLKPQTVLRLRTVEDIRNWVKDSIRSKDRPTAVFALNHRVSSFLMRAFEDENVRVTEDLALIGFDDFDLASLVSPALTVVSHSPAELAHRSIHILLNRLREETTSPKLSPAKIVLPAKLIVRASCGAHK